VSHLGDDLLELEPDPGRAPEDPYLPRRIVLVVPGARRPEDPRSVEAGEVSAHRRREPEIGDLRLPRSNSGAEWPVGMDVLSTARGDDERRRGSQALGRCG
jgi:hypothetical protein